MANEQLLRSCTICGTRITKKWYTYNTGFICQLDYRKARYQATREYVIERERKKYHSNPTPKKLSAKLRRLNQKTPIRENNNSQGKCYQRVIREQTLAQDLELLGSEIQQYPITDYVLGLEKYSAEHRKFIERYEWLGSVGNTPKWVFCARLRNLLAGVVMINEPNTYSNLLGPNSKKLEALIQRGACASWAHPHVGSRLIMFGIRWMVKNTDKRYFVAYSDPEAGEIGTIYQACNFIYLGQNFGARKMYRHPKIKNGKPFSIQSLRRTSVLKSFVRNHLKLDWDREWEKENGYKDLSKLPVDIKRAWYEWGNCIAKQSKVIKLSPKGKYCYILGGSKKQTKQLLQEFGRLNPKLVGLPYPKRTKV